MSINSYSVFITFIDVVFENIHRENSHFAPDRVNEQVTKDDLSYTVRRPVGQWLYG